MLIGTLGLNAESNILCRLYRTVNKPVKLETSLAYEEQTYDPIERSHSAGGHTKTCLRHYQVSAIPETFTIQGPKSPPSIDYSIEEMLNEVNVSLISASCPVKEESMNNEHIELKSAEELVGDRLKSFLSNKSAVKTNENSGFSFFPVRNK